MTTQPTSGDRALTVRWLDDNPLAEVLARGRLGKSPYFDAMEGRAMCRYLAWTPDRGWLTWDGRVWNTRKEVDAFGMVADELQRIFKYLCAQPDITTKDVDAWRPLLTESKARKVLRLIQAHLSVQPEKFDAHPHLLNVQNGVVELSTGRMTPHYPKLRLTKITPIEYRPDAAHEDWAAALKAVPAEVADWLQVRLGQAITGYATDDDVLPILTGGGQNGKSTIVNGCLKAAGGYGVTVPDKVLLANPNEHPTDLMTLRGARLAIIEETPDGHFLPTKRLKDLLGTPTMTARAMRQDFVSWETSHSLFVTTNYELQVAETDHGTWRRLAKVHFPYRYVHPADPLMQPNDVHGIPGLRERIRDNTDGQLEAVLAWMITGAVRWYENGRSQLPQPLTVQADTQSWREQADIILAFARENLQPDPGACIPSKELFEAFTGWLKDTGHHEWNDQKFTTRFEGHEFVTANHIDKGRVNVTASTVLSRRVSTQLVPSLVGKKVMAWKGVRFN